MYWFVGQVAFQSGRAQQDWNGEWYSSVLRSCREVEGLALQALRVWAASV